MVRNPAEHALSQYYFFNVERGGASTDDEAILRWLRQDGGMSLFGYISPQACDELETAEKRIDCALDAYDFVGVVELFDESMLQLATLLDSPLESILYLPSKVSNNSRNSSSTNHGVQGQSPAVRAYLTSATYLEKKSLDFKLWEAAYQRVARGAIGNEGRLLVYQDMLKDVADKCRKSAGPRTGYWLDNGLGFACLDSMYGN